MGLSELLAQAPKPSNRNRAKCSRKSFKQSLRIAKFNKRPGCYVVATGYTKCLDCGLINAMHRLGCTVCTLADMKQGIQHGAYLNMGPINTKDRFNPVMQQQEFITYRDLHKRIIAGERFYDFSNRVELTLKNFE